MGLLNYIKIKLKRTPRPELPAPAVRKGIVKAGLAFGAGGTRGFAHIGVIRAFEENGIEFDCVSGCSAGSIAAAMYCYGLNSRQMEEILGSVKYSDIKSSKFLFLPSKAKNIEDVVRRVIGDAKFEDLRIPLAVNATDLITGEEIVYRKGDIAKVVSASCAVPGVFVPVEMDGYRLADGGLINPVPSDLCRLQGAQVVVSIDIHSQRGEGTDSAKMLDVLKAAFRIGMKSTAVKGILNSDLIIQPDCQRYSQTKLDHLQEMIDEGYRAAMEKMDEIKLLLGYESEKTLAKKRRQALKEGAPQEAEKLPAVTVD